MQNRKSHCEFHCEKFWEPHCANLTRPSRRRKRILKRIFNKRRKSVNNALSIQELIKNEKSKFGMLSAAFYRLKSHRVEPRNRETEERWLRALEEIVVSAKENLSNSASKDFRIFLFVKCFREKLSSFLVRNSNSSRCRVPYLSRCWLANTCNPCIQEYA